MLGKPNPCWRAAMHKCVACRYRRWAIVPLAMPTRSWLRRLCVLMQARPPHVAGLLLLVMQTTTIKVNDVDTISFQKMAQMVTVITSSMPAMPSVQE